MTSAEALAGTAGTRLVDELAAILEASVDRACLRSRGLAPPGRDQALDWLTRYGQRMLDQHYARLDRQAARGATTTPSGRDASSELVSLARHPLIGELFALGQPVRANFIADSIAEGFGRHLIVQRVRLARDLSAIATGAQELLLIREQRDAAANAAIDAFLAQHQGVREVQRLMELLDAETLAFQLASPGDVVTHAPFEGIVQELRARCIAQQRS